MTLLSTTNLSGATTTVSGIDQTYVHLYLLIENAYGNKYWRSYTRRELIP
jgi:hypothetical protein